MESQQPTDLTQEPSFADLSDETLRLSQPSRRRNRDEHLQERHVLPRIDDGQPEGMFARQFHNEDMEVHAWSKVEGVDHYRWLQGPMNHLPREQQLEFIADVM
uniref:Predicted protein n=1 Tax=Physcomitrium patens TaxID=3218 RepID=A9U2Q0_PHYPA